MRFLGTSNAAGAVNSISESGPTSTLTVPTPVALPDEAYAMSKVASPERASSLGVTM